MLDCAVYLVGAAPNGLHHTRVLTRIFRPVLAISPRIHDSTPDTATSSERIASLGIAM